MNSSVKKFNYVADISNISHYIIREFLDNKMIAVDATLGNGYDTEFLSNNFKMIYSFDIQENACKEYLKKQKDNVMIINDSHELLDKYIKEEVDCIMYNLGFLPGGNKEITTQHITSLKSIKLGLKLLKHGGLMTICIYRGHNEGKEEEHYILDYLKTLDKGEFGVMHHSFLNRSKTSPILVVVEKK
ncbi:tRNA (mnm(5)s(2)U34)-methyltransferase [Clostridium taeniosporum]|uniref:rRNA methylase n=1 Tax=Clostridium taeniosporum TaxID=394958 RepID=A0A1D7XJB6_9CLOT|nr:class I SAM-dependent methyltransferase [Clostridium taeniosporum]AOR23437.1 rRNA methylase [Clostridium taeniosporum]